MSHLKYGGDIQLRVTNYEGDLNERE